MNIGKMTLILALALGAVSVAQAQEVPEASPEAPLSYDAYYGFARQVDAGEHEIGLERFRERMAEEGTVILDLRGPGDYARGHIRGAVHLGPDVTEEKLAERIPSKDTVVLTYCNNSLMPTRSIALTAITLPQLLVHGYENVYMLAPVWRGENGEMRDPDEVLEGMMEGE